MQKFLVPSNNILFASFCIFGYLKGEVYWIGDHTEAPFQPAPFPDIDQPQMLNLMISDYVVNSMCYVLQQHGQIQHNLTKNDVSLDFGLVSHPAWGLQHMYSPDLAAVLHTVCSYTDETNQHAVLCSHPFVPNSCHRRTNTIWTQPVLASALGASFHRCGWQSDTRVLQCFASFLNVCDVCISGRLPSCTLGYQWSWRSPQLMPRHCTHSPRMFRASLVVTLTTMSGWAMAHEHSYLLLTSWVGACICWSLEASLI